MISRRNFLKYTGLAIAAAGTGYTSGKLSTAPEDKYFVVQGFLPGDDRLISSLINSLKRNISSRYEPAVYASGVNAEKFRKLLNPVVNNSGNGKIICRVNRLDKKISSDILISDRNNFILDPGTDFTISLSNIREQIRNKPADLFFSLEYSERSLFASIFTNDKKNLVVQNEKGIAERIELNKDYTDININGSSGITSVQVKSGMVRVGQSCCKNKICTHTGYISQPGSIIACAPNKVLIKIEHA